MTGGVEWREGALVMLPGGENLVACETGDHTRLHFFCVSDFGHSLWSVHHKLGVRSRVVL